MAASQSRNPVAAPGTLIGNSNLPLRASRDKRPEFELFQRLPREARFMIWHQAMVAELPRRLVPLLLCDTAPVIVPYKGLISPILAVNKESRHEAERFFSLKVSVHRHIPLNPDLRWDIPDSMRRAATGNQNGTLHLSPEYDLFVRGIPNIAFEGVLFERAGPGIHLGTEFGDEYKLFHFHRAAGATPRVCPSIAIPASDTIAQIQRLAVVQESSHGSLHILHGPGNAPVFQGRIDEARGRGLNFWPAQLFPAVREHFTIMSYSASFFVGMVFGETPERLHGNLDIRRWSFIESHEEEPGRPMFFVSKKCSDTKRLDWTTDEPEDFDYYDVRGERRLWHAQPHWRYFEAVE